MRRLILLLALAGAPDTCAPPSDPIAAIMSKSPWQCACARIVSMSICPAGVFVPGPVVQAATASAAARASVEELARLHPGETWTCPIATCASSGAISSPPDPCMDAGSDAAPGCVATGGDCTGLGDAACCSGSCGGFSCL